MKKWITRIEAIYIFWMRMEKEKEIAVRTTNDKSVYMKALVNCGRETSSE